MLGVLVAVVLITAIFATYSGGMWLLVAADSHRLRRASIERQVRRETSDLDRRLAEFLRER